MKLAGKVLRAAVLLFLLALAVTGVVSSLVKREQQAKAAAFAFEAASDNRFARVSDGLLSVTGVTMELFDSRGTQVGKLTRSYPDALLTASGASAAVWSEDGAKATVISGSGSYHDLVLPGNVISGAVNENGYAAFVTTQNGYKGAVTVYRPDGVAVFSVSLGGSYPLDAAVSPNGDRAAILSCVGSGSRLAIYALDQEAPAAEWETADTLYVELCYLQDGNLMLLSGNAAAFFDKNCAPLGEYSFGQSYLKDFSTDGDGFVTIVLGRYKTGNSGELVLLDSSGTRLASTELTGEVEGLSTAGSAVALRYRGRTDVYSSELALLGSLEHNSETQASLMRSDGSVLILSGAGAAVFEP